MHTCLVACTKQDCCIIDLVVVVQIHGLIMLIDTGTVEGNN